MQVRKQQLELDWVQIGKGVVCQGCILSPCLFKLYVEYIMRYAGLDEAQLESRLLGEVSIHPSSCRLLSSLHWCTQVLGWDAVETRMSSAAS